MRKLLTNLREQEKSYMTLLQQLLVSEMNRKDKEGDKKVMKVFTISVD